jgi:hypothetical protein
MKDFDPTSRHDTGEQSSMSRVKEFYLENPDFDISKSLSFLTTEYPDIDNWVVYSGLAVFLLAGQRTVPTSDADIICRNRGMADDFNVLAVNGNHSEGYLDVKTIDSWLRGRVDEVDPDQIWQSIIASSVKMKIGSAGFRVMHPAIVAAAKSTLSRIEIRSKDREDIATLNVGDSQLQAATELIHGIDPDRNLAILINS